MSSCKIGKNGLVWCLFSCILSEAHIWWQRDSQICTSKRLTSAGWSKETARADTQPGQAYESPLRLLDISTQNEGECEKFIYIVSGKFGISIYRIQYKLFLILFKYYLEALVLSLKIWLIYLSATKLRLLSQIRKQEEANQLNQFILRRAL